MTTDIFFSPDKHLQGSDGEKPSERHDPDAISVSLQLLEYIKPDIYVDLGDLLNLGEISPFQEKRGMSGLIWDNKGESVSSNLKQSFELGHRYWDRVHSASPRTKLKYLLGNHEDWLRVARNHPSLKPYGSSDWTIPKQLRLEDRGIDWLDYSRFDEGKKNYFEFGKCVAFHGQYTNRNFLQQHYMAHTRSFIMGHMHTIEYKPFLSVDNLRGGWCLGCLSTMAASYHRGRLNAWGQAVGLMRLFGNGNFNVQVIPIVKGVATFGTKTFYAKKLTGLE